MCPRCELLYATVRPGSPGSAFSMGSRAFTHSPKAVPILQATVEISNSFRSQKDRIAPARYPRYFRVSDIASESDISAIQSDPVYIGLLIGYRVFRPTSDRNMSLFRQKKTQNSAQHGSDEMAHPLR